MLTKTLRTFRRSPLLRTFTAVQNTENVDSWVKTIANRATSTEAQVYSAQLSSLINYYNKKPRTAQVTEIDWEDWSSQISTPDVVDAVRENYASLMDQEYNVEAVAGQITTAPSDEYLSIEKELKYHHAIWNFYYQTNLHDMVVLESVGNLADYTDAEHADRFRSRKAHHEQCMETHSYLPGSQEDVNIHGFFANQFSWGKMALTYYRHPCDDYKCAIATKNILGR